MICRSFFYDIVDGIITKNIGKYRFVCTLPIEWKITRRLFLVEVMCSHYCYVTWASWHLYWLATHCFNIFLELITKIGSFPSQTANKIFPCHDIIMEAPIYYNDVIMSSLASQITSLTIVYSAVYSRTDQRKHQSTASLAIVRGIHRGPVNSPRKWPVTRKTFPFDDVIMYAMVSNSMPAVW